MISLSRTARLRFSGVALALALALRPETAAEDATFVRGDANLDGLLELADSVRIFTFLFLGGEGLACQDAADSNDTGSLDVSDGIFVLGYLFLGSREPSPPFPERGVDPTEDDLGCAGEDGCGTWVNSIGMAFISIPPGAFLMGSPEDERGRWFVETPAHRVHIAKLFVLGATEVSQRQYETVMGTNPSFFNGGEHGVDLDRPVERVLWDDAVEFCRRLSDLEGQPYRLPTEAEWEYACRAGTTTRFSFGDALECDDLCEPCPAAEPFLWWCGNDSPNGTKPVGAKVANPWCLRDMHGSVWEWCSDWTGRYSAEEAFDPTGPATGEERVLRGGYFGLGLKMARSAMRGDLSPDDRFEFLGFRVAISGDPRSP